MQSSVGLNIVLTLALALLAFEGRSSEATLHHFLARRFVQGEQEGTTTAKEQPTPASASPTPTKPTEQPPRLYPDIIQGSNFMGPPPPPPSFKPPPSLTPFVPFGPQPVPGFTPQQQQQYQREQQVARQNEAFSTGLGKRLLNLVGAETSNANATDPAKALQNSTVLQHLNRGVHSVYDGLSKAYNSTIQQQIELLQERFKGSENSTNPWHQRMAQQVPQFFRSMAERVGEAQNNLNNAWKKLATTNASDIEKTQTRSTLFGSFDSLVPSPSNEFLRSFHLNEQPVVIGPNGEVQPRRDMTSQLREFWNAQVKPHVDNVRGMMMRTWHDLTASGAYNPVEPTVASRRNGNDLASANSEGSTELVNNILKNVDFSGPEYMLVDPTNKTDPSKPSTRAHAIGSQMQTRLVSMQRDLNHLWNGLTKSISTSLNNVRNTFKNSGSAEPVAPDEDPSENEINSKLKEIVRVQREADTVYDVVQKQQQQQQQQQQQRTSISDRFKNFYNNLDLGDSVARWSSNVADFWHKIPDHFDSFMNNNRNNNNNNNNINNNRKPNTVNKEPGAPAQPSSTTERPNNSDDAVN